MRAADGGILAERDPERPLPTASVGKVLLLVTAAAEIEAGQLQPDEMLRRTTTAAVADSGLWQHLRVDSLCVEDLGVLIGGVSDNLATNVLLERIGLERVRATAECLGLRSTALLDRVRDRRTAQDPPHLSVGTAGELSLLMHQLAGGVLLSDAVCATVDRWLAPGVDLSMVGRDLGLDPLAHVEPDQGLLLRSKTGTDSDVRADVGYLGGPGGRVSYAVLTGWTGTDRRQAALAAMGEIGRALRVTVAG